MKELEERIQITFPEIFAGEVMGKLTADGALLENAENQDGIFLLTASHDKEKIAEFLEWFNKITEGRGTVITN